METLSQLQQANLDSLRYFWPELVLTLGVLAVFIADILVRGSERRVEVLTGLTLTTLFAAAASTLMLGGADAHVLFSGLLVHDSLAIFFKWLFLAATAIAVVMAVPSREIVPARLGEYFALLLAMCLGMNLMAASVDFLMVYLSLEMVSIVSYILAGYRRHDRKAAEAALKYVIYGAVASAVMLFGISYFYGALGTTDLNSMGRALGSFGSQLNNNKVLLAQAGGKVMLLVGMLFVLSGIGYKVASVPWHMWCPDVYEGSPTPFTAFLSVAPKAAGFAVAMRVFFGAMGQIGTGELDQVARAVAGLPWPAVLGAIAAVTMTLGNFAAIGQTNLKRLLAYSSIAHAGYLLMGLSTASNLGNMSVLMYLTFYLLMNLGAFLVVEMVARSTGSESIFDYRGLGKRAPFAAVAFAILLFSLTGLPPLAGFVGKFYLFYAVVQKAGVVAAGGASAAGWWALALIGVLNSAVSLYYYARVVKAMFLEKTEQSRPLEFPATYTTLLAGLTAAVVVFGLYWAPISEAAAEAITSMTGG